MSDLAVSFVLPCRDEREAVGSCIKKIEATMRATNIPYEIIVSDSSQDGSADIARAAGAVVVKHDTDGYGYALREGFAHVKGNIVVYADADDTYELERAPELIHLLDHADIALGSRLRGTVAPGAMPPLHRYLGTPLLNFFLLVFFGIHTSDSQTGFRALRRKTLVTLDLKTTGMEFATEMLIKAKQNHFTLTEIPVAYGPRKGNSKLRPYRDGFTHMKYILMQVSLLWYVACGGALLIAGLAGLLFGTSIGDFFTTATVKVLFPFLGIQILFLGLFAKTYLHLRIGEPVVFIPRFYKLFTFKRALALGAALIAVPLLLKFAGASVPFDPLLVATLAGLQVMFNSFVLSTLAMK